MHAHSLAGAVKGSFLEEYNIAHFLLAVMNTEDWRNI
jgi:hypothetical protein